MYGVPAVTVIAPGGALSTKGFSTVGVPPRNTLRVVRSGSARYGSTCCTKDGDGEESEEFGSGGKG